MTDAERDALDIQADLKRLADDEGDVLARAALKLIEALTEQLTAAREDAKEAEAYAEELEERLAKAVEALGLIVVDNTWGLEHETYMKCRAILAEIKSHSDEFATQKGESHE